MSDKKNDKVCNEQNEDIEMSETSRSNWEYLRLNDDPDDRFNCFICTAAGLLSFHSVKEFSKIPTLSDFVRSAVELYQQTNIDKRRGAYLDQVIQFYSDLKIHYVGEFKSKPDIMSYFETTVPIGKKKKFALAFVYDEEMKKLILNSAEKGTISQSLGHIVAIKYHKTDRKVTFHTIDFQIDGDDRITKGLPKHANPPFHLFEKQFY